MQINNVGFNVLCSSSKFLSVFNIAADRRSDDDTKLRTAYAKQGKNSWSLKKLVFTSALVPGVRPVARLPVLPRPSDRSDRFFAVIKENE